MVEAFAGNGGHRGQSTGFVFHRADAPHVGKVCFTVGRRKAPLVHVVPAFRCAHARSRCCRPFPASRPDAHGASRVEGKHHMGLIRDRQGNYKFTGSTTEHDVLSAAEQILRTKLERQGVIGDPRDASDYLRMRLGSLLHEEFHILWLDNRHRILDCQKLFTGTIDGASVYPRETVRAALEINASAAILSHNHPSGVAEPSTADRAITQELIAALKLVGVRVLDHIVVAAGETVSMAGRGLM